MIHCGQRLTLRLKASQQSGVEDAAVNQLERHLAPEGLALHRKPYLPHAAFADLAHQAVRPNDLFGFALFKKFPGPRMRGEPIGPVICVEQRFHLETELFISGARAAEEFISPLRGAFETSLEDLLNSLPLPCVFHSRLSPPRASTRLLPHSNPV